MFIKQVVLQMAAVNCLEVRTVQSGAFKILVEALKELLTDTCIEFTEAGMKIVSMDTTHVILVHLMLDASKFEYYHCPRPKSVGLNMLNLHKLIKTINSNDTLTLFMDADDSNHLGIKIENADKNSKTIYKLNLLEFEEPCVTVPPTDYRSVITLQSCFFQKICRDMHNIADVMEMKNFRNQLIFGCKGEFCMQETVMRGKSGLYTTVEGKGGPASDAVEDTTADIDNEVDDAFSSLDISRGDDRLPLQTPSEAGAIDQEIVQGLFCIKKLVLFTKCTNLSTTVQLFLENNFPLIVLYSVASLGVIKLLLAPQCDGGTSPG